MAFPGPYQEQMCMHFINTPCRIFDSRLYGVDTFDTVGGCGSYNERSY
jgi:hypothetical protein